MYDLIETVKKSAEFQKLKRDKDSGRLYHGYIVESNDTRYVDAFTEAFTMLLMCGKDGCGECDTCRKIKSGVHMDVFRFPCGGRKIISAQSDIAVFNDGYAFSPLEGGARVFVFDSVNSVRDDWQNKMLKSLEEPREGNFIIIRTDGAEKLLPTVRSRCAFLKLPSPSAVVTADFLISEGCDEEEAEEAAWLFDGNLTLSEAFCRNGGKKATDGLFEMLKNCNSSRDCVRYVPEIVSYRDDSFLLFSGLSAIFRRLAECHCGLEVPFRKDDFAVIGKAYSLKAAGEISKLFIKEKKRVGQGVSFQAIADDLLLGMMEVKYRCRQ